MASDKVQTLTDTNFEQSVIKAAQPVVVDFWAEWCGPCRRLAPTIDELATDYDGRVVVGKLNVDENPATPVALQHHGHSDGAASSRAARSSSRSSAWPTRPRSRS